MTGRATVGAVTAPQRPQESERTRLAREEVAKIFRAELELSETWRMQRGALATAEAAAGDVALDSQLNGGGRNRQAANHVDELAGSLRTTRRAIEAARERRRTAILDVWEAEAADLHAQAAQLSREADELDAEIEPLLEQLRELSGCDWAPTVQVWDATSGQKHRSIGSSRAGLLRSQATDVERLAGELARRKLSEAGTLERLRIDDVDTVMAALEEHGAGRIAPSLPQLVAWIGDQVETVRAQRRRVPEHVRTRRPDGPVYASVAWSGGELDRRQCRMLE